MDDAWVAKNFNVDAPGSTSANLPYLGHRICGRPMFPMEEIATFVLRDALYPRGLAAMRIEAVDLFYLSMPEITEQADGSQDALLVRVAAGGRVGFGECEAGVLIAEG